MRRGNNYAGGFTPSILDRLTAPAWKGEAGELRPESREALEAAIQRDLSALLNSRREQNPLPAEYRECATSLLAFGLPDITMTNLRLASEQNRLRRAIETAIQLFEPRLTDVRVRVEHWDEAKPLLRFQIEAYLSNEPVTFDTLLRSESGEFLVRRQAA